MQVIHGHHFNPRTPERGATKLGEDGKVVMAISIHAPLSGVRLNNVLPPPRVLRISIHAPLSGVRLILVFFVDCILYDFNPRTPERGATACCNRLQAFV